MAVLSQEQFARLLGPQGGDALLLGKHNKRRAGRVVYRLKAFIHAGGDGGRVTPVSVRDLSPRGICIHHSAAYRRGEQFTLSMPQDRAKPMLILCTVAHTDPIAEGMFSIGAEFTCVIDPTHAGNAQGKAPRAADVDRLRSSILD